MSWVFSGEDGTGQEAGTFEARVGSQVRLIATPNSPSTGISVSPDPPEDESLVLGIADIQSWGVKLHAVGGALTVLPAFSTEDVKTAPPREAYTIQPETDGKLEVVLLRAQDRVSSSRTPGHLTLVWKAPQVQVDSSVTAEGEIPESVNLPVRDYTSDPAQETEDEDDLDNMEKTVVQPSDRSTPFPPSRTETVVQETPNVERIQTELKEPSISSPSPVKEASVETPSDNEPENRDEVLSENSSTKEPSEYAEISASVPLKRHPYVRVAAKRRSPAFVDDTQGDSARLKKRAKVSEGDGPDEAKPSPHPVRKTVTKAKKRSSDEHQAAPTPARPQRGSQRSIKDDDEYDGPSPRVLFSNSAIPDSAKEAMRYLKKHGASVDSVDDDCNILCVKDGTLVKTMKLLQAIALGIPIVTDKWLLESAKAGHFLPLGGYKPSAPKQEKDWNFSLARIWGQPQNTLFAGYTILFTPKLKSSYSNYREIEQVCKSVGARRVVSKKATGKDAESADTIVLAAEIDDEVADALVERGGMCFTKDFLTNSILRGEVDRQSDEFRIMGPKPKPAKKGRLRKS